MLGLDYNNLYKFFVSLGISLVALAFLMLWLFYKEPFDLLIKADDYAKLLPQAKEVIEYRMWLISHLTYWIIPSASLTSLVSGIWLTIYGLRKWKPIQKRDDEEQIRRIKKLRRELASSSPKEYGSYSGYTGMDKRSGISNLMKEAKEPVDTEQSKQSSGERVKGLNDVLTENQLLQATHIRLNECFPDEHEIMANKRFDNFIFDFVLIPTRAQESEILIEIIRYYGLRGIAARLASLLDAMKKYQDRFDRFPRLRSFLLVDEPELNKSEIDEALTEFRSKHSLTEYTFAVLPVTLNSLSQLTCELLRSFIEQGNANAPKTYIFE